MHLKCLLLLLLVPSINGFHFQTPRSTVARPRTSLSPSTTSKLPSPTFSYQNTDLKALTLDGVGVKDVVRPSVVIGGTMGAYLLRSTFSLPSPLSAPIILGLTSALLILLKLPIGQHQPSLYCGAFAGTTCMSLMSSPLNSLILGTIAATLFEIYERNSLFPGKGGRLGMCATMSSTIFTTLKGKLNLRTEYLQLLKKNTLPTLATPTAFLIATQSTVLKSSNALIIPSIYSALGAISCTVLRRRGWSPVTASSAIGAVGIWGVGGPMGALMYAGSFIGMSADAGSKEKRGFKGQVVAAGFMTLFFQSLGKHFLGTVGGKLGAAALLGVLVRDKLEN